jgi:hypothetical protein
MIKLKLTRSQLFTLCRFTNPATYEAKVMAAIKFTDFKQLPQLYTIIQIGEAVSKKCLYSIKDKYTVSLKYAEGAALFAHTFSLLYEYPGAYEQNMIQILRSETHKQLCNYQKRFYEYPNRQNLNSGGDQQAGEL